MKELLIRFIAAALAAAAADALLPEGGIKSGALRLTALAVTVSVLEPFLKMLMGA